MRADHDEKRFATLQANAALNGVTLHCIDGDFGRPVYIASRWAMTKQLSTLDDIDSWLQMVTGKSAELPLA